MGNLNDICDTAGIGIMLIAFCICGYLLISSYLLIQRRMPCEIRIMQSREHFMYANVHTALLNCFNTVYFAFVLIVWKIHKLDTAPNHVDIMVLMLIIMTAVTQTRSSICARENIRRLTRVRMTDMECRQCPDCKYREEK